jgi:hypothetical protein
LGNGSFADFLAAISVNFIESGARQNPGPILVILPIRPDWAQSIGIGPTRPNQESILAMLPIKDLILVMRRSATMPKNGALLLRCACPDEPEDGKYEYYYVSYSY